MKIYFINSKKENCGVYQYGLRLWNVLQYSKLDIQYYEIENITEFNLLNLNGVDVLFFNWIEGGNTGPYGWYNMSVVNKLKEIYPHLKTMTIMHTAAFHTAYFDYIIDQNPLNSNFPRPLYDYDISKPKKIHDVIQIGSFGFAGDHKGFDNIIKLVNENYDFAQINLHITNAYYGDSNGYCQHRIINAIKLISRKPGIALNITTNFISNQEILDFVYENDLIVFAYTGGGTDSSSIPDYAISTNTPMAVTSIGMFKHVYTPEIDLELNSLSKILEFNKQTNYVTHLRELWSRENLIEAFEHLISSL
jgi:hypothetical protein